MELALVKWATLLYPIIISINAIPSPGLLKVPKVYNALITSDQNLEPSRAYPVIQPVVHRTSIGYAPPFYYTQIGPGFVGPQVLPIPGPIPNGPVPGVESTTPQPPAKKNPDAEEVDIDLDEKYVGERESKTNTESTSDDGDTKTTDPNRGRVPLSFFPNYQSLYYNPFFYGYNPYPHVAPGTYYFDYQPRGPLVPLPPPPPPISTQQLYPGGIHVPSTVPPSESSSASSSSSSSKREKRKKIKVERLVM